MGSIIQEPIDVNPATADWQRLLARTTFQGGGFFQLMVTNLNTTAAPQIMAGSRFEMNGSFYRVAGNLNILDPITANATGAWQFIYAIPLANGTCEYRWRVTVPVFDVTKNGWYHPNDRMERCVIKCYRRAEAPEATEAPPTSALAALRRLK